MRFSDPPVVGVRLVVFFRASRLLASADTAEFVARSRKEFPTVSQSPPNGPIFPEAGPPADISAGEWPHPYTVMEDDASERAILFQDDRFGLTWTFDPESESRFNYPGYEDLSAQLINKYGQFQESLASSGVSTTLLGAEALYDNEIRGIDLRSYVAGQWTNWENDSTAFPSASVSTQTYRVHDHIGTSGTNLMWVTASERESIPILDLSIRVRHECGDSDECDERSVINSSHDDLIRLFLDWTSESMRSDWGPEK